VYRDTCRYGCAAQRLLCLHSGKGAELGAADDFAQVLNVE